MCPQYLPYVPSACHVSRVWGKRLLAMSAWEGMGTNGCLGLSHNQGGRQELLWETFLVPDSPTSVLAAAVMDGGHKRDRFVGKGNALHENNGNGQKKWLSSMSAWQAG